MTLVELVTALKKLGCTRFTLDIREEDGVDQHAVSLVGTTLGAFYATSPDVDIAVADAVDLAVGVVDAKLVKNQEESVVLQSIKDEVVKGPLVPRPVSPVEEVVEASPVVISADISDVGDGSIPPGVKS